MDPYSDVHRRWPPDCPIYLGFWICAVCIRYGRDLRPLFCKIRDIPIRGVK